MTRIELMGGDDPVVVARVGDVVGNAWPAVVGGWGCYDGDGSVGPEREVS